MDMTDSLWALVKHLVAFWMYDLGYYIDPWSFPLLYSCGLLSSHHESEQLSATMTLCCSVSDLEPTHHGLNSFRW